MAALQWLLGLGIAASAVIGNAGFDPAAQGRALMSRSLASDDGFGSSVGHYTMALFDRSGRRSERRLELRTLEGSNAHGERTLVVFQQPRDIAGTILLSHAREQADDLQWLYLPSLRRTKRIAGAQRVAPFVGSEFSFEDLAPQMLDQYHYEWLAQELLDGLACDVIRRTPTDPRSGYSAQRVWIDQQHQQVRKIEFLNRAGQLHKTLRLHDYQHHGGQFWRPHQLDMINHLNGKRTDLRLTRIDFDVALGAQTFEKAHLDRIGK